MKATKSQQIENLQKENNILKETLVRLVGTMLLRNHGENVTVTNQDFEDAAKLAILQVKLPDGGLEFSIAEQMEGE
jgi:hypothetical protein